MGVLRGYLIVAAGLVLFRIVELVGSCTDNSGSCQAGCSALLSVICSQHCRADRCDAGCGSASIQPSDNVIESASVAESVPTSRPSSARRLDSVVLRAVSLRACTNISGCPVGLAEGARWRKNRAEAGKYGLDWDLSTPDLVNHRRKRPTQPLGCTSPK